MHTRPPVARTPQPLVRNYTNRILGIRYCLFSVVMTACSTHAPKLKFPRLSYNRSHTRPCPTYTQQCYCALFHNLRPGTGFAQSSFAYDCRTVARFRVSKVGKVVARYRIHQRTFARALRHAPTLTLVLVMGMTLELLQQVADDSEYARR